MIDEKLLLYFIKTKKEEFEEQSFTIFNNLMNVTRILNELIEMIEDGKFNTSENSVSCCGGECGKQ